MNVVRDSGSMTPVQLYKMILAQNVGKMTDRKGEVVGCDHWVLYEDVNEDNVPQEILVLMDSAGERWATNSPTFIKDFVKAVDFFAAYNIPVTKVSVISGKSKNNREFITCEFAE